MLSPSSAVCAVAVGCPELALDSFAAVPAGQPCSVRWGPSQPVPPARSADCRCNSCLPPGRNLFRIQATFAAEASQLDTAQPRGLDHRRQLVGRGPLLWRPRGRRHQQPLLLPLAAPAVQGLGCNPGVPGHLRYALAVRRAIRWRTASRTLASSVGLMVIGWGTPVDRSNRVDFFGDTGGTDAIPAQSGQKKAENLWGGSKSDMDWGRLASNFSRPCRSTPGAKAISLLAISVFSAIGASGTLRRMIFQLEAMSRLPKGRTTRSRR